MRSSRFTIALAAAAACWMGASAALAQDYPSKPVRMIVPNNAGEAGDIIMRILGQEMAKVLGQPVVVENRPGAGQVLAYEHVVRQSPADGYAMTQVYLPVLAALPVTVKELRFDPLKDMTLAAGLFESQICMVTSSANPWRTAQEVVAFGKANPGKLNVSAPNTRFPMFMFVQHYGLDATEVPYSGGGTSFQAMLARDIHLTITIPVVAIGAGEKVRTLAVTGERRFPTLPDVPTFAELGLPQIKGVYSALGVRTGTPRPVIDRLYPAVTKALAAPEMKAILAKYGQDQVADSGEVATKRLMDEARAIAETAKKAGIQPQ